VTALVHSEVFKLRTTRTTLSIALGMVALIVLISLVTGLASDKLSLAGRKDQFQLLASGSLAAAFAAIVGLMAMTTEFRHGTIRPTLLATPKRTNVLIAKILASAIVGAAFGIVGILISYVRGKIVLSARGIHGALDTHDLVLLFGGTILASALWGAFGAGLGAAIRNQVGAIVGLLVWVLFVENIVFGLVPKVGRWFPGEASNALTQIDTQHQLAVLPGTLIFLAYVLAAALVGAFVTERRDVS
jgi:ABC-2 type transport system permease protein